MEGGWGGGTKTLQTFLLRPSKLNPLIDTNVTLAPIHLPNTAPSSVHAMARC